MTAWKVKQHLCQGTLVREHTFPFPHAYHTEKGQARNENVFLFAFFLKVILPGKKNLTVFILKCSTELLLVWAELLHEEQELLTYADMQFKTAYCKRKQANKKG